MKTEVLAQLIKKGTGFYANKLNPFDNLELVNMPDELSEIILSEKDSDRRAAYKTILNDEVINKTRNATEITRLFETLSNVKEDGIFDFIVSVIVPATFSEEREDSIDDIVNELEYVSKFKLAKIDRLCSFYDGLNLKRSSSDRLIILNRFDTEYIKGFSTLQAFKNIINDENIFKYRNANEVSKMLYHIEYCKDELQRENSLALFSNQMVLESTTFDQQMEILELSNRFRREKANYILKAACLLDLGSYDENMNILLEMAEEDDIDKVEKMYNYIEQIYGDDEKSNITYDRIIEKINIISPTLELCFCNVDDMEKFYNILKFNDIERFDTNTEIYAKNDRGRIQKVKLK